MFCSLLSRQFSVSAIRTMSKVSREIITSPAVAPGIGPYSHAVRAGGTMYLSGQVGMDPKTGNLVPGGIVPETRQALTNLGKILEAGRMNYKNVVKCTVYLADMNEFGDMNKVYTEFFTEKYPARAAFQVGRLPKDARVEIEAVAVDC
ncbi:2-iminobutanoate/2-iminopropanoate deaminase isoform X1 [Ixodes scapularis]|uniref:2-iminobutanoate/2-iminopropanoate deaminase isoform X1 n=1 Tax=Ixodes scapularis TaxID=6945 RepID=UPI001C387D52|nr:2-iminobutanoate/2-iminopropanoate deaminase isoform X1 [Ixodes scapularis]